MSELSDRVAGYREGWNDAKAQSTDRIEALEKHKRLQMEDVMNLGAALGKAQVRIEALEAALRKIACKHVTEQPLWWQLEARVALDQNDAGIGCGKSVIEPWSAALTQSSPPKAST